MLASPVIRTLLFAPAARTDLVRKLPRAAPDVAVLDLEDGTLDTGLDEARAEAALGVLALRDAGQVAYVRTNPPGTDAFRDDLRVVGPARPDGWVLPKCEEVGPLLRALAQVRAASGGTAAPVVLGLETVRGVMRAPQLAAAHPSIVAVYFGAEDFITDIGGRRTRAGHEVLHARSAVVLAARDAGVLAIDQALPDVRDDERFTEDAEIGRDLGYDGKLCIHPRQVELAARVHQPSPAEVEASRRLVEAFECAVAQGDGTPLIDGRMVDAPLVRRARQVLASAGSVA